MPTPPAGPPATTSALPDLADVEALLTKAFGEPVVLGRVEHLAPWAVLRAHLAGPAAGPPSYPAEPEAKPEAGPKTGPPVSVIVKWLRSDPSGLRMDARQVVTERAALRFLAEDLGLDLAPRVLADDMAASLLVLEDLAPRTPLDRVLRRDGAVTAVAGLAAFARALGELGAATAGHAERYLARRPAAGLGLTGPDDDARRPAVALGLTGPDDDAWRRAVEHAAGFGVALPGRAEAELARLLAELADPGPFLALTNGDSEANNFLTAGGDGRLIDFEFAAYRHTVVSAVCLYVPGPAWLTVSDPIATGLEAAYRRALARGVPQADDDRLFGFGLAAACLTWAAARLTRFPALDAREPGENSRLQMVFTLDAAARAAENHRALPHLAGWARRAAQTLRRRWPDTDVDWEAYPAYTPRR